MTTPRPDLMTTPYACRCIDCGRHFWSLSAFDRHWRGRGGYRRCADPNLARQVLAGLRYIIQRYG